MVASINLNWTSLRRGPDMAIGFDPKTIVAGALAKKGVTRVCVIDDVFDPPNAKKLQAEIKQFFQVISEESELHSELQKVGLNIEAQPDINDEVLRQLLEITQCSNSLTAALTKLFIDYKTKLEELQTFCKSLERALKLTVKPFGSKHNIAAEDAFDIVFLDYDLADGPQDSGSQARAIYTKHKSFIYLMSDKYDGEEVKSQFRNEHKLLRGFFQFVPKSELFDIDKFCPKLTSVPTDVPARNAIHDFVDTLEERLSVVKDHMVQTIRDLGLVDYAYLGQLSLNAEDHPLGDYMLRLFSEYLQSKLYEDKEVFQAARVLDELAYLEFLPITETPSTALAKIYTAYLTHQLHAEDFASHAKLGVDDLPWLQLGDILIKDIESPVFAVVNAPCDLQFGPTRANRHHDDAVLLLPGCLRRLDDYSQTNRRPFKTTTLYEFEGGAYRIEWDYLKVTTVPHGEIRGKFQANGYEHKRRFRTGPAFELQSAFVRMIGRLGIDVAPPINQPVDIKIYSRGSNDKPVVLGQVKGGAVTFHRRAEDNDVFALTASGREELSKLLSQYEPKLRSEVEAIAKNEDNKELIEQLTSFVDKLPTQAMKYSVICPFFSETNDIPVSDFALKKDRVAVTTSVNCEEKWDSSIWAMVELLTYQDDPILVTEKVDASV